MLSIVFASLMRNGAKAHCLLFRDQGGVFASRPSADPTVGYRDRHGTLPGFDPSSSRFGERTSS